MQSFTPDNLQCDTQSLQLASFAMLYLHVFSQFIGLLSLLFKIRFNRQTSPATSETAPTPRDAPKQTTKTHETQCFPHESPSKSQSAILDTDYPTDASGTRA